MLPIMYMSLVDDDDLPQFEKLYEKYRQQLYAIAYSILNNEQDAEDAVQIAFQNIANDFKKISQIPCNELPSERHLEAIARSMTEICNLT